MSEKRVTEKTEKAHKHDHSSNKKYSSIEKRSTNRSCSSNKKYSTNKKCSKTDEELKRLAEQELLREARLAAARAKMGGTYGWQKCTLPKTNKTFLTNTILHSLSSNSSVRMKVRSDERKNKKK